MIKVINKNGCEIDFEAAVQHMDSKIGDKVSIEKSFCQLPAVFYSIRRRIRKGYW